MRMQFQTIIFDFDGVLCHDRFYSGLEKDYPDAFNFIQNNIFGGERNLADDWMRGKFTANAINNLVSQNTGIPIEVISKYLKESLTEMNLDHDMLNLAKHFQSQNRKVALVTNNMDVFGQILKKHKLNTIFPVIINSFDHGLMKHDQNGKLFDIALEKLAQSNFGQTLLIDDSCKARETFKTKGGEIFAYKNYRELIIWLEQMENI